MKKASNLNLRKASTAKKDEFYTQLSDIERELKNYKKNLKIKLFTVIATTQRLAISFIISHITLKN